jgi:hypothetical protein
MSKSLNIKPDNYFGRILLAMRPGRIGHHELTERIGSSHNYLTMLISARLVEKVDGGYQITEAGRKACPNRRDVKPSPLHASESSKARKHGWPSVRKGVSA